MTIISVLTELSLEEGDAKKYTEILRERLHELNYKEYGFILFANKLPAQYRDTAHLSFLQNIPYLIPVCIKRSLPPCTFYMTKLSMVVKSGDFNKRYKGHGLARAATGRSRTNGFNSHRNEPRKKRSFLLQHTRFIYLSSQSYRQKVING